MPADPDAFEQIQQAFAVELLRIALEHAIVASPLGPYTPLADCNAERFDIIASSAQPTADEAIANFKSTLASHSGRWPYTAVGVPMFGFNKGEDGASDQTNYYWILPVEFGRVGAQGSEAAGDEGIRLMYKIIIPPKGYGEEQRKVA